MTPVFAHGQLRLYLLRLLDQAPRHGYEVIRALEDHFQGLYSPSAGTVYPRLARLEEEGLVEREDSGRKAVYRITDAGRAEVRARQDDLADLDADLAASVRRLAAQVRDQVRTASNDLRGELAAQARAARAASRVAGSAPRPGTTVGSSPAELALERFRGEVVGLLRRSPVSAAQASRVDAVLAAAREEIRDLLAREPS
ncbi:PadR family transcriptional regulator [Thalassiella azotivora]